MNMRIIFPSTISIFNCANCGEFCSLIIDTKTKIGKVVCEICKTEFRKFSFDIKRNGKVFE